MIAIALGKLFGMQVPAAEFVFSPSSSWSGLVGFREMQHKPEFMKSAGGDGIVILSPAMRAGRACALSNCQRTISGIRLGIPRFVTQLPANS
jgi:hypothetical protein